MRQGIGGVKGRARDEMYIVNEMMKNERIRGLNSLWGYQRTAGKGLTDENRRMENENGERTRVWRAKDESTTGRGGWETTRLRRGKPIQIAPKANRYTDDEREDWNWDKVPTQSFDSLMAVQGSLSFLLIIASRGEGGCCRWEKMGRCEQNGHPCPQ